MSWYFSSHKKSRIKQRQQIEKALKDAGNGKSYLYNSTTDDLMIDNISVRASIAYISSCLFRPSSDIKETLSGYYGIAEVNELLNCVVGKKSKKILGNNTGLSLQEIKKKASEEINMTEYCNHFEEAVGPMSSKILSDMLMMCSQELMDRDLAESILYSKFIMSMPMEMPMTLCNIHCAALYYWVHHPNSKLKQARVGSFNFTNEYKDFKAPHIEQGVSLKQFLSDVFKSDKFGEIAYNYLLDATDKGVSHAFYIHFDKLVKVLRKQMETDGMALFLYEYFESTYSYILDTLRNPQYEFFKNQRHKTKHLETAVLLSAILEGINKRGYIVAGSSSDSIPMYEYIVLKAKGFEKESDKKKLLVLDKYAKDTNIATMLNLFMCVAELNKGVEAEHNRRTHEIEMLSNQVESLKTKQADMRREFKEIKKQNENAQLTNRKLQTQIDGFKKLQDEGITTESVEKLNKTIAEREYEIEKAKEKSVETQRLIRRLENELKNTTEKLDKQENEYLELLEKYDREKDLSYQLASSRAFSEIPMECFVNSIKDKRIVVIGGDMMFPKLQKMEFNNLKCVGAGSRNISTEDVLHADLIVVCTAFVDHSTIQSAMNSARTYKINVLNFNNKNVDMLIFDMFKELNK